MQSNYQISPVDVSLSAALKHKIDFKTKPLGALGLLEKIALQIGLIQHTLTPNISAPTMLVFAGDHGIVHEGVSPYPQEVTWQMVMNFVGGGAAINVFAKHNGWALEVIDAGVNYSFPATLPIRNLKVGYGTRNFSQEAAMDEHELGKALQSGADMVNKIHSNGSNCIAFGEMGIGNTSAAAMIMHKITGLALSNCVGKGTGLDREGLAHKLSVLENAASKHQVHQPLEILQTYGGFEIAMMCGAMLQAASLKMILLIDGFIVSSALLIAHAMHPEILDYCIFAHQSNEKGHQRMLQHFNAQPLLKLNMRLGEGTGAALALPLVQASVNFLNEMASFESAGVSNK